MHRRQGFTLVELLLVVAFIALLVSLLLPTMWKARDMTRMATCAANFRQIHSGSMSYALDHQGKLPDPITLGRFSFRLAPGWKTPNDPAVFPEIYGWAAVLDRTKHLPFTQSMWNCPSQDVDMTRFGTTYAFSIANVLFAQRVARFNPKAEILWDNFTLYPGLSGFMGPFSSYTIPTALRKYPHAYAKPGTSGIAATRIDGTSAVRALID